MLALLNSLSDVIDSSAISTLFKSHFWIVPTVQSIHIIAIALVFTASTIIALRALNIVVGPTPNLSEWTTRLMPNLWWGLLILFISGVCLIISEPHRELLSYVFQLKMLGVVIAIIMSRYIAQKTQQSSITLSTKIMASLLVLLWATLIFAGRWIAYL